MTLSRRPSTLSIMVNWKKNLVVIWMSQFLSIMGFTFSMSFHWLHMQTVLGVTDPDKLKIYVALFAAIAPFSLAIFGPVWGAMADRFGRRLMCLRAYTGAAFFLYLMGLTDSIVMFISMRFLQGVLTGTMTAAQALVAVQTPEKHSGFALGTLNSGVYSGAMAGMALGGICADQFGTRNAFFISSIILMVASLLMLFGTKEDFKKSKEQDPSRLRQGFGGQATILPSLLPVFILLGVASFSRRFDLAMFPLLVQEIHGSTAGAATRFGFIMAPAAIAGALSGVIMGHIADKTKPALILSVSAVFAAIFVAMIGFAHTMIALFALRFAISFCVGGFGPVMQSWISNLTPEAHRGRLFGWIASARAIGWGFAPIASGAVAVAVNIRSVFFVGTFVFLTLAAIIPVISRRLNSLQLSQK